MQKRYRNLARKATLFCHANEKLEERLDQLLGLAPNKDETSSGTTFDAHIPGSETSWQQSESLLTKCC